MRIWYQSYHSAQAGEVYFKELYAHLSPVLSPGVEIVVHGVDPDDSHPHALEEWRAGREMIVNAIRAEREGYDAFVAGHFQDAGLYEARASVDIPVIGLGETSMLHACRMGQRMGLISWEPAYTSWFRHQISRYGLQERVAGIYNIKLNRKLFSAARTPETMRTLYDHFAELVRPIVADGVDVLVPTGGSAMMKFADIGMIDGAPVIDGTALIVKTAEYDVMMLRKFRTGISRVGGFRKPPSDIIEKFISNPKGL